MDLPESFLGQTASEGHVYFFSDDCPVGISGHMHVCVKHHDKYILFNTCSSQISNSVRLAQLRGYNVNTYPVIAPSKGNGFTQPTYIDCNRIWTLDETEFGSLYKSGKIQNTKNDAVIDESGMTLITNGIKLSTEISDEIKEWF